MQRQREHSRCRGLSGQRGQSFYTELADIPIAKVIQSWDAHEQDALRSDDPIAGNKPITTNSWRYVMHPCILQPLSNLLIDTIKILSILKNQYVSVNDESVPRNQLNLDSLFHFH